jgi:hypothetical protein
LDGASVPEMMLSFVKVMHDGSTSVPLEGHIRLLRLLMLMLLICEAAW